MSKLSIYTHIKDNYSVDEYVKTNISRQSSNINAELEPPLRKGNDAKGSIISCANVARNDGEDANP